MHGPSDITPLDKLTLQGASDLTEAELLMLLWSGGRDSVRGLGSARGLLRRFGSLRGLFCASAGPCPEGPGITLARQVQLQVALELARRHYLERLSHGPSLASPRAAQEFLIAQLRDRDHEVFCCLFLDTRHRLLGFEEMFRGTLDGATVHPRDVVKRTLDFRAAAVILAHNHPSGVAEPSHADELITRRLREALALVDVRLLDHLIIGDSCCASLAERGLI